LLAAASAPAPIDAPGKDGVAISSTFVFSDGDGYELQMGRWSRRLAPLFIDFAGITYAEHVLDVGCGTGNLTFYLAQNRGIRAVRGVDFSPAYVEHARCQNHDARLTFLVGDACDLPFPEASFDHALSMLVLQFIPQPDLAVREMRRVTRPGGTIAAATWDTGGGLVTYRMIFDTAAMLDRNGDAVRAKAYARRLRRPGELARAWRYAGLIDVVQDTRTIRMDFVSFADFWEPAEGKEGPVAEYVSTLDSEARTKLRHMVELAYLEGEADGPRSYAATAWVVKGKAP
jgi:SAM-dependent methyltransferase